MSIKFSVFIALATIALFSLNLLSSQESLQANTACGLTNHFLKYLTANGYSSWDFNRTDIPCASFGGKDTDSTAIKHNPIIFIHGNSDIAFGRGTQDGQKLWQTGFRSLATYFMEKGYTKAELYTTTWGSGDDSNASNVYHSKDFVMRMRKFVEAVLEYTQAKQVTIIGHSMGVTIARRIIKGGNAIDHSAGNYSVGPSLKQYVKSLIGLAGANLGLAACYTASYLPTCGVTDGFYPGANAFIGPSTFLYDLNDGVKEAPAVYTVWSQYDDLIQNGCVVWEKITSRIQLQDSEVKKTSSEWTHFAVRDNTGPDIFGWL